MKNKENQRQKNEVMDNLVIQNSNLLEEIRKINEKINKMAESNNESI